MVVELNEVDKKIIELLKNNSRLKNIDIARSLPYSINTVYSRIKMLNKNKVIKKYTIELNYDVLGKPITAYIFISVIPTDREGNKVMPIDVAKKLIDMEGLDEISVIAGIFDIVMKVRVSDIKELNDMVTNRLGKIDNIGKIKTSIVLQSMEDISKT